MSVPKTMKAITISGTRATLVADRPIPSPRPDQLLVKVHAVALNPTDWKNIAAGAAGEGSISGCDYAGEVVQIGSAVNKDFTIGQRVAGVVHGANYSNIDDGAFAEYAVVKADLQMRIPDSLPYEKAATLGLGLSTVNQGLFQKALRLDPPQVSPSSQPAPGPYVLIYGGSTATGSLSIQMAHRAGYRVLTTCSPSSFSFVTSLGAEKAFDYTDPECGNAINAYTGNALMNIFDTVAVPSSARLCAQAFSSDLPRSQGTQEPQRARYGSVAPVGIPRPDTDVESAVVLMYTIFNEAFSKWGMEFPATKEDFESAREFFDLVESLLQEEDETQRLRTHPEKVGEEGLKGVLDGLLALKEGRVRSQKLVYRIADTPEAGKVERDFA